MELSVNQDQMMNELLSDMDDIHDRFGVSCLKPGEFTVVMYAEAMGLNRTAAMSELAAAVASGDLIEVNEERRVGGKRAKHIYRKP